MFRFRGVFRVSDPGVFDPYTAVPEGEVLDRVLVLSGNASSPQGVRSWVYLGKAHPRPDEEWLRERFGERLTRLEDIPLSVLFALTQQNEEDTVALTLDPRKPPTVLHQEESGRLVAAHPAEPNGWIVVACENGTWRVIGAGSGELEHPVLRRAVRELGVNRTAKTGRTAAVKRCCAPSR
ncbi:hypothetical protein [Thermosulfurimonas sp. F29]|uniref:hypothetical protein n=1 Tax=Thermosulfurimonas sp. F29 TaxID=2867247 RepID=UPI001C83359F|nr:hypothetical protein [Thermosulfurimonas sp. F29]MBX6423391.1 hypothetical protein [Thermosulfurimonas sp. F29]